jgi:hypothetical protein
MYFLQSFRHEGDVVFFCPGFRIAARWGINRYMRAVRECKGINIGDRIGKMKIQLTFARVEGKSFNDIHIFQIQVAT